MRYCEECGKELNDNELVCPICGAIQNVGGIQSFSQAVEFAKNGDNRGFEYLYNKTYRDKKYIALKYMKNDEDAEDVLQDSYMKMFGKLDTLENPEKFSSWFGLIVANTAKDALRKKNPVLFSQMEQENSEGETVEFEFEDETIEVQPELSYTQKETRDLVREMMATLSDEQRMCIMMYYIEGLSVKEIAETLDYSENTIKSRLNYGRKNIKSQGEELKRKGYQLYGIAPLPLLLALIRMEAGMSGASSVAAGVSAGSGASAGAGVLAASEAVAGGQIAQGMQMVQGMQLAEGVASATVKKGILATVGGKIAIGIASAAVVGGVVFGAITVINSNKDKDEVTNPDLAIEISEEVVTSEEIATSEEAISETTEATTEEVKIRSNQELFEEYIDDVLVPSLGNASFEQNVDINGANIGASGIMFMLSDSNWFNLNGIVKTDIFDYDGDSEDELLVLSVQNQDASVSYKLFEQEQFSDYSFDYVMMMSVYEVDDQEVVLGAETNIPWAYQNTQTDKFAEMVYRAESDGHRYIVAKRNVDDWRYRKIKNIYAYEYLDRKINLCKANEYMTDKDNYVYDSFKTYENGDVQSEDDYSSFDGNISDVDGYKSSRDSNCVSFFNELGICVNDRSIIQSKENTTPLYECELYSNLNKQTLDESFGTVDFTDNGYQMSVSPNYYDGEFKINYEDLVYVESSESLYDSAFDKTIEYKLLQINLPGSDIEQFNQKLRYAYEDILSFNKQAVSNSEPVINKVEWTYGHSEDLLSIVFIKDENMYDYCEYTVYNVDLITNKELSKEEMLDCMGMTKEEFDEKVVNCMRSIDNNDINASIEQSNVDRAIPMINEDGKRAALVYTISIAGASYYEHIVEID